MYTVVANTYVFCPNSKYMVVGEDTKLPLLIAHERDCQVFAHMMNKAEKEMRFLDGKLPTLDAVRHNLDEEFWQRVKKQLDNDAKLVEKEAVHLAKGDTLGVYNCDTYCGLQFDYIPSSTTLVRENVTCHECKVKLQQEENTCKICGKSPFGCLCNADQQSPVKKDHINFREFI